jgi:hypothetical protein
MSVDGKAERAAIKAFTAANVPTCGGRVMTSLPEETKLARDADTGLVLPYILLTFGAMFPVEGESSIEGFEQQPQNWPIIWECWAADPDTAADMAGEVRAAVLGWAPNDSNASAIDLRGGGRFDKRDTAGRPVRWAETVTGVTTLNNTFQV